MAIRKSSSSGIPFGNTAGRPASPGLGQLYSNGQTARLEIYTSNGWQNIVAETPGLASISGTYNQSAGSGTFTISGTNFVAGGMIYAIGTNAVEYQATTSTTNSSAQMTAVFTDLSPEYEPYDIKVLNPSNLFGLLQDAFYINDSPVWSTSSGSLGTYTGSSIQLAATDDESNTITYSLTSGSLPTGLSLSSAGLISGTSTASGGTYTFTVSASDGSNTAVTRSFSLNVYPVVTGGTLTSDSTYYYRTFTGTGSLSISLGSLNSDILVVAGGGSGGTGAGSWGGGGGAGGYRTTLDTSSVNIPPATHTVTVGGGGTGVNARTNLNTSGIDSSIIGTGFSFSSSGGGRGGNEAAYQVGGNGGSGGGGNYQAAPGSGNAGNYTPVEGYSGASAQSGNNSAGGGGAGASGSSSNGGIGRNTNSTWATVTSTGSSGYYAGGGGSGQYPAMTPGSGGSGGGGAGSPNGTNNGVSGTANTGGGGGGTNGNGTYYGGNGGSGIVIVRYTKASVGG
jgi:hypothetical protein